MATLERCCQTVSLPSPGTAAGRARIVKVDRTTEADAEMQGRNAALSVRSMCSQAGRAVQVSLPGPVQTSIEHKLHRHLEPVAVRVENESRLHNVPPGAETHFKLLIVSHHFAGLPLLKRHRLVNEILSYELRHGIHALSIITKTPDQWDENNSPMEPSPPCRGGFGK